ncbi:MAG: Transcriptional regulator, Xre family [uncultured Paraburkholderia sp.]|nr:MAG: Transcriptional regulator, Xre family [uncultured Paraburkholderia sp.]CAH2939214.1 MAG: Transcriptional regulator, Xre family [uncultured Paraburkholderia sp.]
MSAFRLKILRRQMNLSLQDLADQTELTKSYLSKVERGLSVPSVAVALKLAKALHVEVDQLFDDAPANDDITVVRVADRVPMGKAGAAPESASAYEVLAARAGHKRMLPFVIRPSKDFAVTEFKEHKGEEFLSRSSCSCIEARSRWSSPRIRSNSRRATPSISTRRFRTASAPSVRRWPRCC